MKPLITRSMIVAALLGGIVAAAGTPASAIVGGRDATQTYPGMASLNVALPDGRTAWCGASLIHPRFLLTAAHCVSVREAAPMPVAVPGDTVSARVGSTDRTTGVAVTGKAVHLPPGWMWGAPTGGPVSDLALVELAEPAWMPLTPISKRHVQPPASLRMIGWGLTQFPPTPPVTVPIMLQERDTSRLPDSVCAGGGIGPDEMCADGGACFGDSGGPALRPVHTGPRGERRWALVGITSRGTTVEPSCGGPGIFTDPTFPAHRAWIAATTLKPIGQPCTCPPTPFMADNTRADLFQPLVTT